MYDDDIKEYISSNERNPKLEKHLLEKFSNILRGHVDQHVINEKIEINCANGIYLVPSNIYSELSENKYSLGFFNKPNKVIFIDEKAYNEQPNIAMHELGHAFLNSENVVKLSIDDENYTYGNGLEEGAMSIFMNTKNISNLNVNIDAYHVQAYLFLQLDEIYKQKINEYPNLLIHLFNEKNTYCELVRKLYSELLDDNDIILKSALAIISGSDLLSAGADDFKNDTIDFTLLMINSMYLSLIDDEIKEKVNKILFNSDILNSEEKLLFALFGDNIDTYKSIISTHIEQLSTDVLNTIEDYDDKHNKKSKKYFQ